MLDNDKVKRKEMKFNKSNGDVMVMDTPYFDIQDEIVWGATAGILSEFKLLMQQLLALDRDSKSPH